MSVTTDDWQIITPAAWRPDCQGKQDYDGTLLQISCRYWPGDDKNPNHGGMLVNNTGKLSISNLPYGKYPHVHASIYLNIEPGSSGDYRIWRDRHFVALTEAEVKAQTEHWVAEQIKIIIDLLGGKSKFNNGSSPYPKADQIILYP